MHDVDFLNAWPSRRRLLALAAASATGAWLPWRDALAAIDDGASSIDPAAFAADRVERAVALLTGSVAPRKSSDLTIDAPDLFEDGAAVPLTLRGTTGGLRRLAVLIDRNPTPLVAVFTLEALVAADFGIRVKMAETSDVRLLGWSALPGGVPGGIPSVISCVIEETRRRVAVVEGGCGDEPIADDLTAARLPGPMRIRAERRRSGGTGATVRILMRHPMETGLRNDGAGHIVAAWHITRVRATLNGALAFTADWGNAVSANPYLQFTLPTAAAGDRVAVEWTDNRGGTRRDEATVA